MLLKKGTDVPFLYPSKILAKIEKNFLSSSGFRVILVEKA
jgi:hypothetical protein